MAITNIILIGPEMYSADIDGMVWSGITPSNYLYENVMEAIKAGAPVSTPPQPTPESILAGIKAQRAAAYTTEADPLFFKYQRAEADQQEWIDKVEEIRLRYPYPEE